MMEEFGGEILPTVPHQGPEVVTFLVKSLTEPLHGFSLVKNSSWGQISLLTSTHGVGGVSRASTEKRKIRWLVILSIMLQRRQRLTLQDTKLEVTEKRRLC